MRVFWFDAPVKWLAVTALALVFASCMTLENRRDLYTADFDRWPVSRPVTTTTVQTTATTATTTQETRPVRTRKTAPEVKPLPSEPEEQPSLPPPLPPP